MTQLFSPLTLRGLTLKNRLVVSPMCQYSAGVGIANDWHFAHLARFALGGFGMVIVEATAVAPEGRITTGDLGLWNDAQIVPLARIAAFLKANGAAAAIQIAHAGRKASSQRPWEGDGPLGDADALARAEPAWPIVAPSAVAHSDERPVPHALDEAGLARIRSAFADATRRSGEAGFDVVEIHAAHGYLLHEFLSPISNKRTDRYGGSREKRMRFPLEVVAAVRKEWPQGKPLFIRISCADWAEGGLTIEDSIAFARAAKAEGADLIDCSGGGISNKPVVKAGPGFMVPFAEAIKREAGIATMCVGLITQARQAAEIVDRGEADLVALGREALYDPQWPLHAEFALNGDPLDYHSWPVQAGHWLRNRAKAFAKSKG